MEDMTWGRNPVLEALKAGRPLNRILLAGESRGRAREIAARAREQGVPLQIVEQRVLDSLTHGAAHQGVVAYLSPKSYVSVEDILTQAAAQGEQPCVLILAGWEDPRNFGAILRSAEAAGVHGVIIPARRAVPLTGTVAKASAGALEHLSISRVGNLRQAVITLKNAGLWVFGADPAASLNYWQADLKGPLALVIGGEGKGLGPSLTKACDYLIRIPMRGKVGSLNAAVAGSILLYEVLRQRAGKLT
ncbi:MAG: 23S rRNA (guanosine(2251)-2'-O)-methyltransferase RlmB [Bacillota bacterium]|nr:23S rRNA (guanosine(2251)-2'-O)-methyltransferase RlmB [Bacillota bacterium]